MVRYRREGEARAAALGNRGPIRFTDDGAVDPAILDAYEPHGFYVFEGVLGAGGARRHRARRDRHARPRAGHEGRRRRPPRPPGARRPTGAPSNLRWVKPLSDPVGRHERGQRPAPGEDDRAGAARRRRPSTCVQLDPRLAAVLPGLPARVRPPGPARRRRGGQRRRLRAVQRGGVGQAGRARRVGRVAPGRLDALGQPATSTGARHGFNFMAQLYGCTSANGLWVVPGSHRMGKVDIKAMVAAAGSDRLPDAVPLVCAPGDVAITNRQCVHGSFANTSPTPRVTINFGFHRRRSVLGVESGGVHNAVAVYDEARIHERSKAIVYAIDARAQRFPDEARYVYQPFAGHEDEYRYGRRTRSSAARLQPPRPRDLATRGLRPRGPPEDLGCSAAFGDG